MSDLINETQEIAGVDFAQTTPAQRAQTLRGMIDQELLVQRSLALNLSEEGRERPQEFGRRGQQ